MNIQKFTQNSLQAVQNCEKVAYEYGNQEIEQEHLLYALVTQDDSLIIKLLEKMNIQKELFIFLLTFSNIFYFILLFRWYNSVYDNTFR